MTYRAIFPSPLSPWQRVAGVAMVLVPPFTSVWPFLGLMNPLWGSFFGFPMRILVLLQPHPVYGPHPWYEFILLLVWPFTAMVGLALAAFWVLEKRDKLRTVLAGVWIASLFFLIPIDAIGPFAKWPLYGID